MSGSDIRPPAPGGQEKNHPPPDDGWAGIRIRMELGALTGPDIERIYGVSYNTVAEWESAGLKGFKPGTKDRLYRRADVETFLGMGLTFTRKSQAEERKANARKRKKAEGMG